MLAFIPTVHEAWATFPAGKIDVRKKAPLNENDKLEFLTLIVDTLILHISIMSMKKKIE